MFNKNEEYYLIWDFVKEYNSDGFKHVINQGIDTNFYYITPNSDPDSLIFVTGKYFFLCNQGKLTASQMDYYYQNADSLKRVRGNLLPPLPSSSKSNK